MIRLARLKAQAGTDAPQTLRLVHQYAGESPATALQAAGYTSKEVAGREGVFLWRGRPWEPEGVEGKAPSPWVEGVKADVT